MEQVCSFFMKNDCNKGGKCKWIHDYDLCRDLYFGNCKYGDSCKYYHGGDREEYKKKKVALRSKGKPYHQKNGSNFNEKPKYNESNKKDSYSQNYNSQGYTKTHDKKFEPKNHSDEYLNKGKENFYPKNSYNDRPQNTRKAKNTTDFNPNYKPADIRIQVADGTKPRYTHPSNSSIVQYTERDVSLVTNLFPQKNPNDIYNALLEEVKVCGDFDDIWALWHGDNHLIINDKSGINWKAKCPTFNLIIERLMEFFELDVKATRFNWYRDSSEWKPFHHDAAAVDPHKAKTQNFTVGVSFGATRDIVFQHATNFTTVSFPLGDGMTYTFGKQVNMDWKHGVPQVHPDKAFKEGRIGIIVWGKNRQAEVD